MQRIDGIGGGPTHVALIMDGNGRWATQRGLPRTEGHRRGAQNLERLLQSAGDLGIEILTLYAFSSDNWRRPESEVEGLMRLFHDYLRSEAPRCRSRGLRLQVIGRRDRLAPGLVRAIEWAERLTRRQRRMLVRVAIDYSARWAICTAASSLVGEVASAPRFRQALARAIHSDPVGDPDLIVRTGGEQRLSDFLLWESAYSELVFSDRLFPDFGPCELEQVVAEFAGRNRRFGGLPPGGEADCLGSALANLAGETRGAGSHTGERAVGGVESVEAERLQ